MFHYKNQNITAGGDFILSSTKSKTNKKSNALLLHDIKKQQIQIFFWKISLSSNRISVLHTIKIPCNSKAYDP